LGPVKGKKPLSPKTRKRLFALNALLILIPAGYLSRTLILRTCGALLVVNDSPVASDAIVVLAGGEPGRALEAADLYRAGLGHFVVVTAEPPPAMYEKAKRDGVHIGLSNENYLRVLAGYGVPDAAIIRIEEYVSDTFDEISRVRDLARKRGWTRIIIVTSNFHTRRSRMVARYLLEPQTGVAVVSSHYDNFRPDAWWTSEGQVRTFAIELEKLITYSVYIWPRNLWKSHEDTKPSNTSSVQPDSLSMQRCCS
jgi:uncharacterized SAM-binding protein YcdF (DUF218 family)